MQTVLQWIKTHKIIILLIISLIICFVILTIIFCWHYLSNRSASTISQSSPSLISTSTPDFTAFAKVWWHHGVAITINIDGTGEANWRTGWCSDNPTPPCDTIEGNAIVNGGKSTLKLSSINSKTASGKVVSTNDPKFLMVAPFTLTILEYGMSELNQGGDKSAILFCGPDFAKLAPKSLFEIHPCGA